MTGRSSSYLGTVDTTLYLERSQVRGIIIVQLPLTGDPVLKAVDALTVFTADDICGAAQAVRVPAAWGRVIDGKAVTVSRERTRANNEPLYAALAAQPSLAADARPDWEQDRAETSRLAPKRSTSPAVDGGEDPYITDLKFANTQNIKAARKYKARLDFMEAKYGAIDWDGALPSTEDK